jgi:hypothetical protein
MPPKRPITLGDIIEVYCSKCRLNLDASVAAIIGGEVVKVMCRTCGNEVPNKPPVDPKLKKEKALERLMKMRAKKSEGPKHVAPSPESPAVAVRKLWDDLTATADPLRAKVYDRHRTYAVNDVVLHKQFGMGVVHAKDQDDELNVLFRDGFQRLESNQPVDE